MLESEQVRADTLTLLLAYRTHQNLPTTLLMLKLRECCEKLLSKTTDENMIAAYCEIVRAIYDRRFADVVILMHVAENNYAKVYMND